MYAKLLGLLLFACQIILNGSHVIRETTGDITNLTPTLVPAPSTLPEGYVRFPDLHAAYKVYETRVTWEEARRQCIAEGADLAIADTDEKIERIYAMQSSVTLQWISVGIQKLNTTENWIRVDNGLPLASIPWIDNHPYSDWGCTGIAFGGHALASMPCYFAEEWYVCEIPMVPVIKSSPTRAPAPSTLPEGYVRFPHLHAAYKVHKTRVLWARARDQCIAEGADLAIVDTVEKIERIYAMQSIVSERISVGIRKSNTTADWVRVDNGHSLASLPWSENYPDPDNHGDCIGISLSGNSLINFNCTDDFWQNWYVCEISI